MIIFLDPPLDVDVRCRSRVRLAEDIRHLFEGVLYKSADFGRTLDLDDPGLDTYVQVPARPAAAIVE